MVFDVLPLPRPLTIPVGHLPGAAGGPDRRGVVLQPIATGGNWQPSDQQSGILDQQCRKFAMGAARTLVNNRVTTDCWMATDRALWGSRTAGIWWDADSEDKLTIGPFLTQLGRACGAGPFLPPDVTGLGTVAPGGTTGSSVPHADHHQGHGGRSGRVHLLGCAVRRANKRTYRICGHRQPQPHRSHRAGGSSRTSPRTPPPAWAPHRDSWRGPSRGTSATGTSSSR